MIAHPVFSIEGRVALVTGSGRGIGRSIARGFAEAGARVAINVCTHLEQGEAAAAEIEALGGEAIVIQADVSERAAVEAMIDTILARFGRLDILVNNAGVVGGAPAEDLNLEVWNRVLGVNLTGVYLCSAIAAQKAMIPQRSGHIINVSSISGEIGHPGGSLVGLQQAAYHAAKGGVNTLTRALALEWVPYGITVNTISPGWIDTGIDDAWFAEDPTHLPLVIGDTPMRRLGKPDELIGTAIYLSSDASSFITGQNLTIDGGYTIW